MSSPLAHGYAGGISNLELFRNKVMNHFEMTYSHIRTWRALARAMTALPFLDGLEDIYSDIKEAAEESGILNHYIIEHYLTVAENPETNGPIPLLGRQPRDESWAAVIGSLQAEIIGLRCRRGLNARRYFLTKPLLDVLAEFIDAHERGRCPVCQPYATMSSDSEDGYDDDWTETDVPEEDFDEEEGYCYGWNECDEFDEE